MPTRAKTLSQLKHPAPDNRLSAAKRGCDANWRKLRNWFIKKNPLCKECLKDGLITACTMEIRNGSPVRVSNEVDHIIPHRGNEKLKRDPKNLQTLCKSHHSRKTATEDGGFGHKTN